MKSKGGKKKCMFFLCVSKPQFYFFFWGGGGYEVKRRKKIEVLFLGVSKPQLLNVYASHFTNYLCLELSIRF